MITSFITTNSFSQKTIGSIDRIEKEINSLIDKNTKIEVLADGFDWSEGPVSVSYTHLTLPTTSSV